MSRYLLFCLFVLSSAFSVAQVADTTQQQVPQRVDSLTIDTVPTITQADPVILNHEVSRSWHPDTAFAIAYQILQQHPYFGFKTTPVVINSGLKQFRGKEILFYVLIGFLLLFALLRQTFAKYFNDLFRLFFRTTLKQRQIREQLIQTPLPSLIFNGFFVLTTGFYINLLLHYYGVQPFDNFWLLYFYCCLALSVIYLVKYVGLKITGWLLNMNEAANAYIFVVFIINKVIGIFLLPFIVLLSFMNGNAFFVALVLSWCGIALLLLYRLLLTYVSVRNLVRFNLFHFLVYLLAFEVAPLLLVYKALMFFFR